jgi:hypothetical protein
LAFLATLRRSSGNPWIRMQKAGNGVTCLKVFQDVIARWRWAEWPFGHYVTDKLYTTL